MNKPLFSLFSNRTLILSLSISTLFSSFVFANTSVSDAITTPIQPPAITKITDRPVYSDMDITHPAWAKHGMVTSQEAIASKVGLQILEKGGNAVDAAVAVGFALAVTLPRAGNLGGGGFMMIYDSKTGQSFALDYRETAPKQASKDMYLDKQGNVIEDLSKFHGLASGVPGTVDGLLKALKTYGTMPLNEVIAPAIKLAEEGIKVTPDLYSSLIKESEHLQPWPATTEIFFKGDRPFAIGDILKQTDLANTLKLIAKHGRDGFYKGRVAEDIAKSVVAAGGIMTIDDLANYHSVIRKPVTGNYRGFEVISMPPPSSGGIHLIQILNILENFDLALMGHNSAQTIHYMAEAMKLAYADRSKYLGDSDFVKVPMAELISKSYAKKLAGTISADKARPASEIKPGLTLPYESDQTTHYSIVDKQGNMVSNTYTLNYLYGSGLVAKGTGVLMNNEMDDFSAKAGVPNGYGLIGGSANAIEPQKRPLSSMTPTFLLKDGKPYLVTGTPGGSRIITTILQIILNVVDYKMNISEATNAIRIHHQWLPDEIRIEKGLNIDTIRLLETEGYKISIKPAMGSTQSIMITPEGLEGATDPRQADSLAIGY